jgi:hypothetical protein
MLLAKGYFRFFALYIDNNNLLKIFERFIISSLRD